MDDKNNKNKLSSLLGTLLFHALLLAILSFTIMTAEEIEEEGLLVNYGDSMTGSGEVEPAPSQAQPQPETTPPPPPAPAAPSTPSTPAVADGQTEHTQDFEEAAALQEAKRKADEEAKRKAEAKAREEAEAKAKAEAEAIAKAKAEAEAKAKAEAERIAKAKAEAEAKAKAEAEARAKAEAAEKARKARDAIRKGLNGDGIGKNASQGTDEGSDNQGNATDKNKPKTSIGDGSGNSYSLAGRNIVGKLPKPVYTVQEEGKVIVAITVDRNGNVTNATVQSKGTTVQNRTLWNVAVQAAKKAKFNADPTKPAIQSGTITYNFRLQ